MYSQISTQRPAQSTSSSTVNAAMHPAAGTDVESTSTGVFHDVVCTAGRGAIASALAVDAVSTVTAPSDAAILTNSIDSDEVALHSAAETARNGDGDDSLQQPSQRQVRCL